MTPTDIANLSLDIMKEAEITNFEQDNRPIVRWMKRNFGLSRDSLIARYDWNFAISRALLAKHSVAPDFGWNNRFVVPSDSLRVLPLTVCGNFEGTPIQHEVEGPYILTNAPGPIRCRYIFRNEDYDRYPSYFCEALAGYLAMKCGHWVTGKVSYVQIAQGLYDSAMATAWRVDAIEGTAPRAADSEWINQR